MRIVAGRWPGNRIVVGKNGRFGVRPAEFAALGSRPSPLLACVDAGDTNTEFCWQIGALPSSGLLAANDAGGALHSGASDGSYVNPFHLWTVADGAAAVVDRGDTAFTTVFGTVNASAPGATLTLSCSLLPGAASAGSTGTAPGALLTVSASLLPGTAAGQMNATAPGVTLALAASFTAGSASASQASTAPGALLQLGTSLLAGSASGQSNASAPGALLQLSASLLPGAATGLSGGGAPGALLVATLSFLPGAASGTRSAIAPGALFSASVLLVAGAAYAGDVATTPIVEIAFGAIASRRVRFGKLISH